MLKIIGGEYRSRILVEPADDEASRPYLARMKESVFNLLRGWFEDARVLDLFAGVGTVGLEAVSRGASEVVMFEQSGDTFERLRENIETLGCGDRARAVRGDALGPGAIQQAPRPVDLLFIDPPYAMMQEEAGRQRVLAQIGRARSILADPSFVILRTPLDPAEVDHAVPGFAGPEVHDYGKHKYVLLYQPEPDVETAADAPAPPAPTPDGGVEPA